MNTISRIALISAITLGTQAAFAAVSSEQAASLKTGQTEQQVISALGQPENVTHWANGTHSLSYTLKNDAQEIFYVDIADTNGKVISEEAIRRD